MGLYHELPKDSGSGEPTKLGRPPVEPELRRTDVSCRVEEIVKTVMRAASGRSGKSISQLLVERVDILWSERERSRRELAFPRVWLETRLSRDTASALAV